ncbi:inactive pancreatic lipase-related protein 1-like [Eucyclogobius newberryi]|uniref:inactive pancreatic lipase-related protein 1-like n=1 Tax=Eucyclogobius newberryi TaxID=166745 RepID=UPI003B5C29DF
MGIRFLLFTQRNKYYQEIKPDGSISASNYNGKKMTRFIIPGALREEDEDWAQESCRTILSWESVNCVVVEWKKGVRTSYAQAANNVRVLGAQVAHMVTFLMSKFWQKADRFHVIGHSLGAHAAGDVGSRVKGLLRITGLDPTGPYFQGTEDDQRLDITDAVFVDVIHTDSAPFSSKLGLGISEPVGHADFYPNGGEIMPGCSTNRGKPSDLDAMWQGMVKFDFCNHARAHEFYTESVVRPQGFIGFSCADKETFEDDQCFPCKEDHCPQMGHHSYKSPADRGKYYLKTGDATPYGRYSFHLRLTLDGPMWPNPGIMYVSLTGDRDTTEEHKLHVGSLVSGWSYEMFLHSEVDVGEVSEVSFRWNNHIPNLLNEKYGASTVELLRGKDGKKMHFCGTGNVQENQVQEVMPCPL